MHDETKDREPPEKQRHILVAVDDSESARRAVLYVADFLGGFPRFRVTLFNVVVVPQEECFLEGAGKDEWIARREAEAKEMLERYRRMLVQGGFPEERVGTRVLQCESEAISSVILKAHEELNTCTVVVGRRTRSRQEEFLFGSVSSSIVKQAHKCSVWVVD